MSSTNSNDVVSSIDKTTSLSSETLKDDDLVSTTLPEQCVAVLANSANPYDDFRRSMREMVGARLRRRENVDWGFMEELLFCYLDLNDKKSYKYILGAFVDLVVDLRRDSDPDPARSRNVIPTTGAREEEVIRRRRRRRVRDE